jgi:dTDP-4-dehydrorhamnose reductase
MSNRVLVLGSSGMAGHVITLRLSGTPGLKVLDAGPRKKVFENTLLTDLNDPTAIERLLKETTPDFIVNCIGVLVKQSETDRLNAIWINAYLPNLISRVCEKSATKLIHLSTDCVFSGKNGPYREIDHPDGNAYYDRTKALGEVNNTKDLTIRTSIAGPELKDSGTGLFDWFMTQKGSINGFTRASWSGVMTPQLAEFINYIIIQKPALSGLVHYATPGGITKFELLSLFKDVFHRNVNIVPVEEPILDKRLLNTRIDIENSLPNYREQVERTKRWVMDHPRFYTQYGLE